MCCSTLFLALFSVFILSSIPLAEARYRFEEGDWVAWGDGRQVYDIEIGRDVVYFGTEAGVQRWDRNREEWLDPWYTVPGAMDEAYTLQRCREVLEDPLTLDLYVRTSNGWFFRNHGTLRWERGAPSKSTRESTESIQDDKITEPSPHLVLDRNYSLGSEGELEYRLLEWPFTLGAYDQRDHYYYVWDGFGIGIAGEYTNRAHLYPMGPGRATHMDIDHGTIWVASELDREEGWVWNKPVDGEKWSFFHPNIVFGLEPGKVKRLRVAPDKTVWIATDQGVMFRNGKKWRHVRKLDGLPSDRIHDLAPTRDGAWICTEFGMARIANPSGVVLKPSAKTDPVPARGAFTVMASDDDTVWAAGSGVIMRYDDLYGWQKVRGPFTIASATRASAMYAQDGILAVGDKLGFAWRDSSKTWQQAFSSQWKDGTVLAIAWHGGFFWLGTDRGLVKYHPGEKDVYLYTNHDGLAGKRVTEIIPDGDWLWLGTDKALVRYHWNVFGRFD